MRRAALLAVSLVLLAIPAAAAPRLGPAVNPAPEIPAVLAADPRLGKAVTPRIDRAPLWRVLAQIGRQAGVGLKAKGDVADEPAIVFVNERQAAEVMTHLSLLFNFRWARTDEAGKWRYELYQDERAKREEVALREGDRQTAWGNLIGAVRRSRELSRRPPEELQREHEQMHAAFDRYFESWQHLSKEQQIAAWRSPEWERAHKPIEIEPDLLELQDPVIRVLTAIVDRLTSSQRQALEEEASLRLGTLPQPETALLPADLSQALRAAHRARHWERAPVLLPGDPEGDLPLSATVTAAQADWAQAEEFVVELLLTDDRQAGAPFLALEVEARPAMPGVSGAGAQGAPVRCRFSGDASRWPPPESHYPECVPAAWKADPLLGRKGQLAVGRPDRTGADPEAEWRGFELRAPDLLSHVAREYHVNLVADAYRATGWILAGLPDGTEQTLGEALNRWVLGDARWTKEGNFIHVRSHTWYVDRLAEVPERLARPWARRLRRNPRFSLPDLAALAGSLPDEQLEWFEPTMREQGIWLGVVFYTQLDQAMHSPPLLEGRLPLLRAYARLLPGQQQALLRGGSVRYESMPATARAWLRRAVNRRSRYEGDGSVPARVDGAVLSLSSQPLRPVASEWINGNTAVDYLVPGSAAYPDLTGAPAAGQLFGAMDVIPAVPDLVPPRSGPTAQALFRLRWPDGREVVTGVILPIANFRTRPPDLPSETRS